MFESTLRIVQGAEAHLLGFTLQNQHMNGLARLIWFPLNYLILGFKELFKPTAIWWALSFLFLLISSIVMGKLEVSPEYTLFVFNICVYAPMVMVIFAVPSTYAFYGVETSNVKHVAAIIIENGVDSVEKIELLEQNIESISLRIRARITFYKWLVGAVWAVYLFQLNVELRFILKASEEEITKSITQNLESFILMLISTAGALILVMGYKRASELLIKTIEFAAVEQKTICLTKA